MDVHRIIQANALRRREALRLLQSLRERVAACPDVAGPVPAPDRSMMDAESALTWAGWYVLDDSATRAERLRVVDAAIASLERSNRC